MRFLERVTLQWMKLAFGTKQLTSIEHRGLRFGEEAIEAMQACGIAEDKVIELVRFIYKRPKGNLGQEIGGSWVTLLGLAYAHCDYYNPSKVNERGLDWYAKTEVMRVLAEPIEHFTKRNAAKDAAGFKASDIAETRHCVKCGRVLQAEQQFRCDVPSCQDDSI